MGVGSAKIVLYESTYVNPNGISAGKPFIGSRYVFTMDSSLNGRFSPPGAKQKQGNRLDPPEGGGQTKAVALTL
jgi:hypothetical protein